MTTEMLIPAKYVFPAYAGMSRSVTPVASQSSSFPRLRGDEPANGSIGWGIQWFSPPTRG